MHATPSSYQTVNCVLQRHSVPQHSLGLMGASTAGYPSALLPGSGSQPSLCTHARSTPCTSPGGHPSSTFVPGKHSALCGTPEDDPSSLLLPYSKPARNGCQRAQEPDGGERTCSHVDVVQTTDAWGASMSGMRAALGYEPSCEVRVLHTFSRSAYACRVMRLFSVDRSIF